MNHLNKYQIIKVPLAQKIGENKYSIVSDNLLGFPDNLKITEDNKLWVAIPSLRDQVTNLIDNNALIRKMIINSKIPVGLFLALANFSLSGAIKIDPHSGQVEDYFMGKSDDIYFVTGALQRGNKVYLSSLGNDFIAVLHY